MGVAQRLYRRVVHVGSPRVGGPASDPDKCRSAARPIRPNPAARGSLVPGLTRHAYRRDIYDDDDNTVTPALVTTDARSAVPASTAQSHDHDDCGTDTHRKPESIPLSPSIFRTTVNSMGTRWWQFRKRKDERCAQITSQFYENARRHRHSLVTVLTPTQFARRGSKAIISVDGGPPCDAWFWWFRVAPGQVVAVDHIGQGWGPHTHRHGVIYIGSAAACGAHAWLSADVWARAQKIVVGGRRAREPVWVAPSRR